MNRETRHESEGEQNTRTTRKLWIGIGILVLLSPLGVVVPRYFGAGRAWGEWGLERIEEMVGFVPEGMKRLADTWKAPLPDYSVHGQGPGAAHEGLGYLLTGIIGIVATIGVMYLITRLLVRRNGSSGNKK